MSGRRAKAGRPARVEASDPRASVFVAANAGSGKTSTLVTRVARLLLAGAPPEAILCVTFTKAAAAEMQRRLFRQLGGWAVMKDADLTKALADIEEAGRDLNAARALFARALETPGGLKIQTIHAFCEKLLRRFPLEAGISPGFAVLEDAAAVEVSRRARESVAEVALARPKDEVAEAYFHFSVQLDHRSFETMFGDFAARREAIEAYARERGGAAQMPQDVWRRCGFDRPQGSEDIARAALKRARTAHWRRVADILAASGRLSEAKLGAALTNAAQAESFEDFKTAFLTGKNEPRKLFAASLAPADRDWLEEEQKRCLEARERIAAARLAEDTIRALTLAVAYAELYDGAKDARGALDFTDLVIRSCELLTRKADAAWVLYKLDGGLEHVLLDEAQDTAPGQWDILRALTAEFFHGQGAVDARRTIFAVGDPKQSIFSFQGAAPERLALEEEAFSRTVTAAGETFRRVPLLKSWRSTPEILTFVDRVSADPRVAEGLAAAGENVTAVPPRHLGDRGAGGCVELSPLEEGEETEVEADPWDPLDKDPAQSAGKLLAARIAAAVAQMVARGEAVGERDGGGSRPCRFGDVLILVRRRNALFHEIIRALKKAGVPVAGADRLKLSEHGVFEDLMALGRLARFESDDLSLAVLLRSPFCDVSEEGLFDLAYGRQGSLWRALATRAGERREWADAARFLAWARDEAAGVAPFDFYCRALGRIDGEGRSMRQRILTRLGAEAEQALDAFVGQVLAAESAGVVELEGLLHWMGALDLDIKREQDEAGGTEARVMTVHGAKGLEAPIVILPDTSTAASWQGGRLIGDGQGGFVWTPRADDHCAASRKAVEIRDRAVRQESARLLYVAMTRARDRLIVAGVKPKQDWRLDNSWYRIAQEAFAGLETHPFPLPGGGEGLRHGPDPVVAAPSGDAQAREFPLPAWAHALAPADPAATRLVSPSRLEAEDSGVAPSPLSEVRGLGRWRRGEIIHRLLQLLPELPAEARADGAQRLLARETGLDEAQRQEMAAAALGVLEDARFAAVFGPGSRAEVAVVGGAAGLPGDVQVSGRVDRLLVTDDLVLVADFKTNRPAPSRIEDSDPAYIRQMAVYVAVLAGVFPGRRIEAALLWTDGPKLMPVPGAMLDAELQAMRA
ncbi:MAG: double-strand break repair helicase AddA [Caulobacteraceae bacterium]